MRVIILFSLFFVTMQSHAQYSKWLNSDRGGEGNGPFTVGKNTLQVETGWAYTDQVRKLRNPLMEADKRKVHQYTDNQYETRFRLGLSERIEASAGISYLFAKDEIEAFSITTKEDFVEQIDLSFRGNLYKGKVQFRPWVLRYRLLM